jgi:multiple sugar transport system ATP-binding protein
MAQLEFDKLCKEYDNSDTYAVRDLDLTVADGEFMVVVGPSGCGKTTALRMVAGLERITSGTLRIGDRIVNDVAPKDRDIAMVFQDYALYPQMTVQQNIGFGLRQRGVDRATTKQKVDDVAALLGLEQLLDRKPGNLSGGQRQRVAMGRALVRDAQAFLMDEPLSNLDAKLRVKTRAEVMALQRQLGTSTLYVTHDQVEAMTMGHRVAVMCDGRLQQCDTPAALYEQPHNIFVAGFIGSPAMNLFTATLDDTGTQVLLGQQRLALGDADHRSVPSLADHKNGEVIVGFRPEELTFRGAGESGARTGPLTGNVQLVEALGNEQVVYLTMPGLHSHAPVDKDQENSRVLAASSCVARLPARPHVSVGDNLTLRLDLDRLHFFNPQTGEALERV